MTESPEKSPLSIGIVCYPLIGGSGILATELGEELAARGHTIHFFSYARPVRLHTTNERIHFHEVSLGEHTLFPRPDYTLPLAVRLAEVAKSERIDVFHVHYAVPHATAAFLAGEILGPSRPRIVTTLHGTDTTLFGRDPNFRLAIEHALAQSDVVTTVSESLRKQTLEAFDLGGKPVEVIHNFFTAEAPTRDAAEVRAELEAEGRFLLLHMSNLRPVKRMDLLLRAVAACRYRERMRLVILAGGPFEEYEALAEELGVASLIRIVRNAGDVENYLQAADAGLYTSEAESFGLSILESMFHGVPVAAFAIGGVPEVVVDGETGWLQEFGDVEGLAARLDRWVEYPEEARKMGEAGRRRAEAHFTAEQIIPAYEAIYRQSLAQAPR